MTQTGKRRAGTTSVVLCAAALAAIAGCGEDFANEPRAPVPIELSGVIQADRVTVSPAAVGAGPVRLTISNQSGAAQTVTLAGSSVSERVGPVNPLDTATIQKTLAPGSFEVRAGPEGSAKEAAADAIAPAELRVGSPRPESNDRLLLP
ncbi:MAG: hypothetical protein ACR2GL_07740 [Thermoleophilaceae bacterium]